ncbi:PaaI family thioesterase [Azonexus sp. IMCC34842]|uniref:PaaI family thioesterase n=1 Tax=Azonexus sp. IMCC34842 TaxID=3420950 RepID=UPI003D0AE84C
MSNFRLDISVDALNERGGEYLPGYLGIEMVELQPNSLRSRMPVKKLHFAPNNFLHAASVVALADTTCGYATIVHLPEGAESFTTIELKSNHLGTVTEGSIACVATAQHLGRNTQVWDAVVTDEASGRKLALFRCTQMILWPRSPKAAA